MDDTSSLLGDPEWTPTLSAIGFHALNVTSKYLAHQTRFRRLSKRALAHRPVKVHGRVVSKGTQRCPLVQ